MATLPVTITSADGSTRTEDGKGNVISSSTSKKTNSGETVTVSSSVQGTAVAVKVDPNTGQRSTVTTRSPVKTTTRVYQDGEMVSEVKETTPQAQEKPSNALPQGAVRVGNNRIRYQGLTYSEKDFYAMQASGGTLGKYDAPNKEELVYRSKLTSIIGDYGEYNEKTGELSLYAPKGTEAYSYISGVLMAAPKGYVVEETRPGVFFIGKADYSTGQSGFQVVRDTPVFGAGKGGGSGSGGGPSASELFSPYAGAGLPAGYFDKVSNASAARVAAADSLGIGTNKEIIDANVLFMRYALKKEGTSLFKAGQSYSSPEGYVTPMEVNPAYVVKAGLFEAGRAQQVKPTWLETEKAKIRGDMATISSISNWITAKPAFEARAKSAERVLGGPAGQFTGNFIRGTQESGAAFVSGAMDLGYFYKPAGFFRKQAEASFITEKASAIPGAALYGLSNVYLEGGSQLGTYSVLGKWVILEGAPRFAAGVGVAATARAGVSAIGQFRQTIGGIEYGMTYNRGTIPSLTEPSGARAMFAVGESWDMSLAYGSKGVKKAELLGFTKETPLSKGFFFQETYKINEGVIRPVGANILGPEGGRLYNIPGGFESPNVVARGYNAVKVNNIGVGGFADDAFYSYSDDLAYSNLGGFDKYSKALSYADDAIGAGRTTSPFTEETRYLLSENLGREGWKGGQYIGYQFKGQGVTLDTADDILTFSTGRPAPYITQSYSIEAGQNTQVFLGTVQTGEGVAKFRGFNINVDSIRSSAPDFGGVMKAGGFFDDVALGVNRGVEGTSQVLKGATVRAFSPPPSLLSLQRGGSAVVSATKTATIQPALILPKLGTQQKPVYDTKLYDGAFAIVEAPRLGGITEQSARSELRVKPIVAPAVGVVTLGNLVTRPATVPKLRTSVISPPAQAFKPSAIFKPLGGQETRVMQMQSLKVSPMVAQIQITEFAQTRPPSKGKGGEPPFSNVPTVPQFQFSQFAFPGVSRVQDKSGKQSKGYTPSVLGKLIGFTAKKAPSKVFAGSEIRPVVLPKVKTPKKKKSGWWFF